MCVQLSAFQKWVLHDCDVQRLKCVVKVSPECHDGVSMGCFLVSFLSGFVIGVILACIDLSFLEVLKKVNVTHRHFPGEAFGITPRLSEIQFLLC